MLLYGENWSSRMEQLDVNANTQLFSLHIIFERFINNKVNSSFGRNQFSTTSQNFNQKKKKQNPQTTVNLVPEKLQLYFKKEYLAGFENLTT